MSHQDACSILTDVGVEGDCGNSPIVCAGGLCS